MFSNADEKLSIDLIEKNEEAGVQSAASAEDGVLEEEGSFCLADRQKQVRRSTAILIVVFFAGILSLLYMIRESVPTVSVADETQDQTSMEEAIARITGVRAEMSKGMEQIIKKFYEFSAAKQVAINNLVRNPFKTDIAAGGQPPVSQGRIPDMQLLRIPDMQLLMIMKEGGGKDDWCCMINDKFLHKGEAIGEFRVTRIDSNFVVLESEKSKVVLRLKNDESGR